MAREDIFGELTTKCQMTCLAIDGHEKPAQDEMYERHTDIRFTSNQLLRPELFKEKLKVCYPDCLHLCNYKEEKIYTVNNFIYTVIKLLFII